MSHNELGVKKLLEDIKEEIGDFQVESNEELILVIKGLNEIVNTMLETLFHWTESDRRQSDV
jgi:hypothetical protein